MRHPGVSEGAATNAPTSAVRIGSVQVMMAPALVPVDAVALAVVLESLASFAPPPTHAVLPSVFNHVTPDSVHAFSTRCAPWVRLPAVVSTRNFREALDTVAQAGIDERSNCTRLRRLTWVEFPPWTFSVVSPPWLTLCWLGGGVFMSLPARS